MINYFKLQCLPLSKLKWKLRNIYMFSSQLSEKLIWKPQNPMSTFDKIYLSRFSLSKMINGNSHGYFLNVNFKYFSIFFRFLSDVCTFFRNLSLFYKIFSIYYAVLTYTNGKYIFLCGSRMLLIAMWFLCNFLYI